LRECGQKNSASARCARDSKIRKKELADVSERARERERESRPVNQASGAIIWLAWLVGSTDAGRDNPDSADLYASKKSARLRRAKKPPARYARRVTVRS
jgi:hypothetical protein